MPVRAWRAMPSAEHEVVITCPRGHRLGRVRVNLRGRPEPTMEASPSETAGPDGLRLDPARAKLIGQCPFCPVRSNTWIVPARALAGVLAAMLTYGPSSLALRITELRAALPGVIPSGDEQSRDRRRWFGRMMANLSDTHST